LSGRAAGIICFFAALWKLFTRARTITQQTGLPGDLLMIRAHRQRIANTHYTYTQIERANNTNLHANMRMGRFYFSFIRRHLRAEIFMRSGAAFFAVTQTGQTATWAFELLKFCENLFSLDLDTPEPIDNIFVLLCKISMIVCFHVCNVN
jgi:hypothetical protein